MCGILFTNKDVINIDYVIEFLKKRGPDATTIKKFNQYTFIHTLLSMTGPLTEQPFVNNNIICMFNGEIYNFEKFGDYTSDGECLIPLYEQYGDDFISQLDGEFALVLMDLNKNKLIISTDIFGTRPLWMGFNDNNQNCNFGISTYKSCLDRLELTNNFQILANTTYIFDLNKLKIIEEKRVHIFDLNQYKTNFDDWNKAFENSIKNNDSLKIQKNVYRALIDIDDLKK
jgi:asparagine synthase (glutamine-hydrolysing)